MQEVAVPPERSQWHPQPDISTKAQSSLTRWNDRQSGEHSAITGCEHLLARERLVCDRARVCGRGDMGAPMRPITTVLRLPDGRDLGYCEFGDPGGIPIIGFQGHTGARLEA